MGLLTLLSPSGRAPPGLVSAIILANGTSLEVTFDDAIIAGSATLGFSRSVSSITSGAIAGNVVTLTIPKAYIGDSVGTLTYSGITGTLAGAGGFVASFGPVAITNNSTQEAWTPDNLLTGDNFELLLQSGASEFRVESSAPFTQAVAADPVGNWEDVSGEGNNVIQATTANKPTLRLVGASNIKALEFGNSDQLAVTLAATISRPYTLATVSKINNNNSGTMYPLVFAGSAAYTEHDNNLHRFITGGSSRASVIHNTGAGDTVGWRLVVIRVDAAGVVKMGSWEMDGAGESLSTGNDGGVSSIGNTLRICYEGWSNNGYRNAFTQIIGTDISDADLTLLKTWAFSTYGSLKA